MSHENHRSAVCGGEENSTGYFAEKKQHFLRQSKLQLFLYDYCGDLSGVFGNTALKDNYERGNKLFTSVRLPQHAEHVFVRTVSFRQRQMSRFHDALIKNNCRGCVAE